MLRFSKLCTAILLSASASMAMADAASHAADAERFLKLAHADKLTVPVYGQVQQMFAQRFAQAPDGKKAVLESYQAKRSEEHTSELQSRENLVCRLLLEKK